MTFPAIQAAVELDDVLHDFLRGNRGLAVSTHPIWAHTDFALFYYLVNLDYYYVYCYAVYCDDII